MWLGGSIKCCRILEEFNGCSAAMQVIWMNYPTFNMQHVGMLLHMNWSRLQCHAVYHFIIQICYRTPNVICVVLVFRSLHRLWSPGYSVPPLAKQFHILCNRFLSLFSQSMLSLSQTCLAKICILLCICIEVNVTNTPEGLFILCVQDSVFPYFVFPFLYYGTVSFRSSLFPQIKLLINWLVPLLCTDYPWHYRSFGGIPVYREKIITQWLKTVILKLYHKI